MVTVNPDDLLRDGRLLHRDGKNDEARQSLEEALGLYRTKIASGLTIFRTRLAETLELLSEVEVDEENIGVARTHLSEALSIRRTVSEGGLPHHEAGLAIALRKMGVFERRQGDTAKALSFFAEATPMLDQLTVIDRTGYSQELRYVHYTSGAIYWGLEDWRKAADAWDRAARVSRDSVIRGRQEELRPLARYLHWKARAEKKLKEAAAETATYTELVSVRERICEVFDSPLEEQRSLAKARADLGSAMGRLALSEGGGPTALAPAIDQLSSACREIRELHADEIPKIGFSAWYWYELAWYQERVGAIADAQKTLKELEVLVDAGVPEANAALAKAQSAFNRKTRRESSTSEGTSERKLSAAESIKKSHEEAMHFSRGYGS